MITASTGLDSFTDPADITVLYPFPGTEVLLAIVGLLLWIGWHVVQMRSENKEYDEALELYEGVGMERAMHFSGSSHLVTDEDIEVVRAQLADRPDDPGAGRARPDPEPPPP